MTLCRRVVCCILRCYTHIDRPFFVVVYPVELTDGVTDYEYSQMNPLSTGYAWRVRSFSSIFLHKCLDSLKVLCGYVSSSVQWEFMF